MTEPALAHDVAATVRGNEAELIVDGVRHPLTGATVDEVRETVFQEVTRIAVDQRHPVRFTVVENGVRWYLVAEPDGRRRTEFSEPVGRGHERRPIPQPALPVTDEQVGGQDGAAETSEVPTADPLAEGAAVESAVPEDAVTDHAGQPAPPPFAEPEPVPSTGHRSGAPDTGFDRRDPGPDDGGMEQSSDRPGSTAPDQRDGYRPVPVAPQSPAAGEVVYGGPTRRPWPPEQTVSSPPQPPTGPQHQPEPGEPQPRHAVSFLPPEQPVELPGPQAPQGFWARLLGRKNEPDPALLAAQRAEAADQALVSKHWPGPKTIAVVNGKGGSGKTPTTALLAAVFARFGGGGVIAWDNNDTRGTLGWRTAGGGHDRTVLDLIPATEELMDRDAQVGRLAYFVHHQPEDKYDVLRSNPSLLAREQRLSTEQFRALHAVCNRFYRLIFMDSGNDESTYAWLNMIEAADQIVVPTTTRPDHAEAALLLLQALRNRNAEGRELADRAVVIVSQADQDEAAADTIAAGFQQLLPAENVVTIPYDRAIRDSQLRYDRLSPVTKRAFLRAAAAVAGQL